MANGKILHSDSKGYFKFNERLSQARDELKGQTFLNTLSIVLDGMPWPWRYMNPTSLNPSTISSAVFRFSESEFACRYLLRSINGIRNVWSERVSYQIQIRLNRTVRVKRKVRTRARLAKFRRWAKNARVLDDLKVKRQRAICSI